MTGLDPARHVIVEIATLVTDDNLAVIAEGPDLVVHAGSEKLEAMEPVVREMHTRSGLLSAIEASTLTLDEAGRQTLEFLKEHVPARGTVPLCGNSIGTDRRFLAAYLPDIENWLHYRSIDVSTVKEFVPAVVPRPPGQGPGQEDGPSGPRRRARVRGRAGLLPGRHLRARGPGSRVPGAVGRTGPVTGQPAPESKKKSKGTTWTFAPSVAPACVCPHCVSGR